MGPYSTRGRLTGPSVIQDTTIWVLGSAPKVRCRPWTGEAPPASGVGAKAAAPDGDAAAGDAPSSGTATAPTPAVPSRPTAVRRLRWSPEDPGADSSVG